MEAKGGADIPSQGLDVEETLKRIKKKAVHGKPRRAYGMAVNKEYEEWYIDNMDRFKVELPQSLKVLAGIEAHKVISRMRGYYPKDATYSIELCDKRVAQLKCIAAAAGRKDD